MVIQNICFNEKILNTFAVLSHKKAMAHAYLFIGPKLVGKMQTALAIAQLVNCEQNTNGDLFKACGVCGSCIKIEKNSHPDIETINIEFGQKITIEMIRSVLDKSRMRAFEARKKVFIISSAESLTIEAANAFLKTLEEPSQDNMFFLTTSAPESVLSTIKSRCQQINFYPFSRQELMQKLKDRSLDNAYAHFLAFTAEGCLGKALELHDSDVFNKKNEVIDQFILSDDVFYLKEIEKNKAASQEVLNVLQGWLRDAILFQSGIDENLLINVDRMKDLKRFSSQYTLNDLTMMLQETIKMKDLLLNNFNIKINFSILKTMLK